MFFTEKIGRGKLAYLLIQFRGFPFRLRALWIYVKFYERKRRRKSKDFSLEKLVRRIFEALDVI
jgi:hypothetical protein